MGEHIIYNKRRLCFTEVSDFTDFQGVGSDPLYRRYESVKAVMRTCISDPYQGFLAQPIYDTEEDTIEWYADEWTEHPRRFTDLTGEDRSHYQRIKDETVQHYRNAAMKLENEDLMILGGVLKFIPDETIFCYDGKVVLVAWGMRYDTNKHTDIGSLIHAIPAKPDTPKIHQVMFKQGGFGTMSGNSVLNLQDGERITPEQLPVITPMDGYRFTGWDTDPLASLISGDTVFTAQYEKIPITTPQAKEEEKEEKKVEPSQCNVTFLPGSFGKLKGVTTYTIPSGSTLSTGMIPKVKSKWRYQFTGWDTDPLAGPIKEDTVFTAQYEKKKNWFAAIWPWLWKILLALLLLLLLFLLLRNCGRCTRAIVPPSIPGIGDREWVSDDPNVGHGGGIYDPGNPYEPVPTPPEYRDVLPPNQGVLPPIGDNDPIRTEPGQPTIIANRINVLMENEDKSILDLARDFKAKYTDDKYQVVYYDDVIKRMQIVVPEAEREAIKARLPQEFAPEYNLFVFDESLFEGIYRPSDPEMSNANKTWYLDAIGAFDAWDITTGSEELTVAIVDNGFNIRHKEFKDKVKMPYNVWMHNADITQQFIDHGTHVAGTAIALANNGAGLCGIAPKCKFMPIQVADQMGRMTTTSVLDGVIYAIYQGADVVNISLGGSFSGLDQYPERLQRELINNHFKEEERLWNEVSRIAETHKVTIVVAAGNDNVLAGIEALQRPKNIIIVSAVNKQRRNYDKADFSNYGEYSTLSAPGVDIYSTYGNSFKTMEGTSMAAPIVTGAIALMKSLNKDLTTEQIICILRSTGKSMDGDIGPMIQLKEALLKVKNNEINDCVQVEAPNPSHGDVEITLHWDNYNDLDLSCDDPQGDHISFQHKHSRSGGQLEIDMNVEPQTKNPIEHIYWPTGGAPAGTYIVQLNYYKRHERNINETPYTIDVKFGGKTETYTGTISSSDPARTICSFTLNGNGSGSSATGDDSRQRLIERRDQLQREIDEINRSLRNQ